MPLYIPIEVKVRELAGRTLLALTAAEAGIPVFLGRKREVTALATRGRVTPGVWFAKSISPNEEARLAQLHEQGHELVSQDEEGGVTLDDYGEFARHRYSRFGLDLTRRVYCWGDFDRTGCETEFPVYSDRFVSTGSPRVDLWRPDMMRFFESDIGKIGARYGRYVLIVSTLGRVNNQRSIEDLIQYRRKIGNIVSDADEATFQDSVREQQALFDEYVAAIDSIANRFHDVNIVVRPHPAENPAHWHRRVGKRDRVHVVQEGTIDAWVHGAEAIVHNSCTTGFQGVTAGVPTIAFTPFHAEHDLKAPNNASVRAGSREELIALIDAAIASRDTWRARLDPYGLHLLGERFTALDGPLASDRILQDMVENVGAKLLEKQSKCTRAEIIKRRLRAFRARWGGQWANNAGQIATQKCPYVTAKEVESIRRRFVRCVGRFGDVGIRGYGQNAVAIVRKN